jgi:hypothetical protein
MAKTFSTVSEFKKILEVGDNCNAFTIIEMGR